MLYEPKPYAKEARKMVGKYLVNELGFTKKTPLKFYRYKPDICPEILLEKPSMITYAYCGIVPLYLPGGYYILNGERLSSVYTSAGFRDLAETAESSTAELWAQKTIQIMRDEMIPFMERLTEPEGLIGYLMSPACAGNTKFTRNPFQIAKLIAYTYAYMGKPKAAADSLLAYQYSEPRIVELNQQAILDFSSDDFDKDLFFREIIAENKKKIGMKD